ncbi:MAG: DUF4340 domain-containing protein [Gammaproteobacteria bacterium]|nr:DUF4340 domain-containing protein [Gammaproteobacteria bacterium]
MQAMLTRRWIINFLLIAIIVIFYFVGDRYWTDSPNQSSNPISRLKPADIMSVAYELDGNSFVLSKSSDQWQLETPVQWPANNITVERIIAILASETETSIAVDGIDLTALGLQDPKLTLRLNDTVVLFGATNNINDRRYILIGSTIFLLADVHLPFMVQGISGLIDKRLLPGSISLQALDIAGLRLNKNNTSTWNSSNNTAISTDQINRLVSNWQTIEAGTIRRYDPSASVQQKIVATLSDGSSIEFLLMAREPELVIARPDLDLQYHFTEKYFDALFSIDNAG